MNFWLNRKKAKPTADTWFRGNLNVGCGTPRFTNCYVLWANYGWNPAQHCSCEKCEQYNKEYGLELCTEGNKCRACLYKEEIEVKRQNSYYRTYSNNAKQSWQVDKEDEEAIVKAIKEAELWNVGIKNMQKSMTEKFGDKVSFYRDEAIIGEYCMSCCRYQYCESGVRYIIEQQRCHATTCDCGKCRPLRDVLYSHIQLDVALTKISELLEKSSL